MKLPKYWWFVKFLQFTFIWICILLVGVGGAYIWHPISSWIFADSWQWMPIDRLVRYLLLCIPIGLWASLLLTGYEWWQNRE